MKKISMLVTAIACGVLSLVSCAKAQNSEVFEPYKTTDLRMPSVPLIMSDPYFSIWSPFDKLNEGSLRHWTHDEKPIDGLLRVDGVTYCFMGEGTQEVFETVVPMADEERWTAMMTRQTPAAGWEQPDFKCGAGWEESKGAFGTPDQKFVSTRFGGEGNDIYVRRTFDLTEEDLNSDLYVIYSHDDCFWMYLNGNKIIETGEKWLNGVRCKIDKSMLKVGENVIATHTHNTTGGAYTDFGVYKNVAQTIENLQVAEQKSVDVLATSTYYTFACGPVELDLVFTAPHIINDYDLLSSPINYISYQVRSTDGAKHDVQFFLGASPLLAVNEASQATVSTVEVKNGVKYLKTGTIEQPILAKRGDGICIDWGYFYMPNINGEVSLGKGDVVRAEFAKTGVLPASEEKVVSRKQGEMPTLAYVHNFGSVDQASSYALVGYDEIWDIEYMHKRYKGYWAHEGEVTIFDMFDRMASEYSSIMAQCREQDKQIYDDAFNAGGVKYAELLSGTYRHVNAAHKLFKDDEGNLLFFSKENNSNGCVNTVDLTYPESPLYLTYNPELEKAMITSILEYTHTGRWPYAFAAHDLGTYPMANGNVYGDPRRNDGSTMPLEENANIITLAAIIAKLDGDLDYVKKYWDILTLWSEYLVEYGKDPAHQLCTDDFKGPSSRNSNLSVKATMGIAAYAELCKMLGKTEDYDKYMKIASEHAHYFVDHAKSADGNYYRMEFDGKDTDWSLKYNMVWDKLWGWNLYNDEYTGNVIEKEIAFYLTKLNEFGVPLDSRDDSTKSDWVAWTAAMTDNPEDLQKFMDIEYKYADETTTRWPLSDWHHTETSGAVGFRARSVLGGYWMPVFAKKLGK